jgi:hypothetical protein
MTLISIKKGNDPFKKYWWAILLAFAGIGLWVCLPLMDTSVGSVSVARHGLGTENQSLDSMANPNGAPGSAYDLSMDGTSPKKKTDGELTSSLYQAPPEDTSGAAAPGAPLTAGAGTAASFAQALKDVSKKSDASGWGGAKAQAGFTAPKGNFSSLSGLGGSSAGSGASSGGGSQNLFGQNVAKTAMTSTRGLGSGDSGAAGQGGKPVMNSLNAAKSQGLAALSQKSMDAGRATAGGIFDGSRAGNAITGGQGTALGGSYSGLDAAPANLKINDPNANVNKQEPVPAKFAANADTSDQMKQAIIMMVVSAVVGGVVTGIVGSIFPGAGAAASSAAVQAAASAESQKYSMKTDK